MSKRVFITALFLWGCFVAWQWLGYRASSSAALFGFTLSLLPKDQYLFWFFSIALPSALPYVVPFFSVAIFWVWLVKIKRLHVLEMRSSYAIASLGFIVLTWFIFVIVGYFRFATLASSAPPLAFAEFFPGNIAFLSKLLVLICAAALLVLSARYWGGTAVRIFGLRQTVSFVSRSRLLEEIVVVAIGVNIIIALLFVIGMLGWLRPGVLFVAFAAPFIIERASFIRDIKEFVLLRNVRIPLSLSFVLLAITITLLVSSAAVDLIRTLPRGFDSHTYYYLRMKLMVERGSIVPGGFPFPFELLAAALQMIFRNPVALFAASFSSVVLGAVALFGLSKSFFSSSKGEWGIFAVALWLSLGMTSDLGSTQAKPDVFSFFFSVVGIWLFFEWMRNKEKGALLGLTFFFLGSAAVFKLTAFFLVGAVLAGYLFLMFFWNVSIMQKWGRLFRSGLWFLAPFFLWCLLALVTRSTLIPAFLPEILSSTNPEQITISEADWRRLGIDHSQCRSTGLEEDFSRFYNPDFSYLKRLFVFPWEITMNYYYGGPAFEFGFAFLALLPMGLLFWRRWWGASPGHRENQLVLVCAVVYWALWVAFGKGAAWYGFSGIVFLILPLTFLFVHRHEHGRYGRFVIVFLLVIYFVASLFLRVLLLADERVLQNAAGSVTDEKFFLDQYAPQYAMIRNLLNDDASAKILATASYLQYYVSDSDRRMYVDRYFDDFNCLHRERDDTVTLYRLRALGFEYVLYNFNPNVLRDNKANATFPEKFEAYERFLKENLVPIVEMYDFRVYRIPQ